MVNARLSIAVFGATGRMGDRLLTLAARDDALDLRAAWTGAVSPRLGQAVPGTALVFGRLGQVDATPQVLVDFSRCEAFDAVLSWCRDARVALVSGTTGLSAAQRQAITATAGDIPVLWAANFSPGVAVLTRAVADAARLLPDWQVEIIEAHHAGKRDAPSGTALALGEAVAAARSQRLSDHALSGRDGIGEPRKADEIGFASVRAGDIIGEHTVLLAGQGERLELVHRAGDRDIFARGALMAAKWLAGKPPGLYRFEDVFAA